MFMTDSFRFRSAARPMGEQILELLGPVFVERADDLVRQYYGAFWVQLEEESV